MVDRGQLVAGNLCSRFIDGRFLFMYTTSFTFILVNCGSLVSTLVLLSETECPVASQWSPTPVGMDRLVCSLKLFPIDLFRQRSPSVGSGRH